MRLGFSYLNNNNIIITSEGEEDNLNIVCIDGKEIKINDIDDSTPQGDEHTTTIGNLVLKENKDEYFNINVINRNNWFSLKDDCDFSVIAENLNIGEIDFNEIHRAMILLPKQDFLATKEEIAEAQTLHRNERLEFPKWNYLKTYENKYGDIFAKYEIDRRTVKTEPCTLGIAPEHTDKIMLKDMQM